MEGLLCPRHCPGRGGALVSRPTATCPERLCGRMKVGVVNFGIPATTLLRGERSEVEIPTRISTGTGSGISGRGSEQRPQSGWHLLNGN